MPWKSVFGIITLAAALLPAVTIFHQKKSKGVHYEK